MSEQTRSPTWGEVINNAIQSALTSVNTAMPGGIVSYDPATQLAHVKPLIPQAYEDESGERQLQSYPVIPNCPVQFPTGGGMVIMWPLSAGDTGIIVCSQASLDRWISGLGGEVDDPGFDHRHSIADSFFIPGIVAAGAPRRTDPGNAICIGVDGGPFQGAGLGATLMSILTNFVAQYNLHQHTSAGASPPTTPVAVPLPNGESATVKVTP